MWWLCLCSADAVQVVGDRPVSVQDDLDTHWNAETCRPCRVPKKVWRSWLASFIRALPLSRCKLKSNRLFYATSLCFEVFWWAFLFVCLSLHRNCTAILHQIFMHVNVAWSYVFPNQHEDDVTQKLVRHFQANFCATIKTGKYSLSVTHQGWVKSAIYDCLVVVAFHFTCLSIIMWSNFRFSNNSHLEVILVWILNCNSCILTPSPAETCCNVDWATAIGSINRKFGKVCTCGLWDMFAGKHVDTDMFITILCSSIRVE